MSQSTSSEPHLSRTEVPQAPQGKPGTDRPLTAARLIILGDAGEMSLWLRLEDHEEGRLAIEADHLFDSSYAWAV